MYRPFLEMGERRECYPFLGCEGNLWVSLLLLELDGCVGLLEMERGHRLDPFLAREGGRWLSSLLERELRRRLLEREEKRGLCPFLELEGSPWPCPLQEQEGERGFAPHLAHKTRTGNGPPSGARDQECNWPPSRDDERVWARSQLGDGRESWAWQRPGAEGDL